jgi:phage terminase large subunit-like protein
MLSKFEGTRLGEQEIFGTILSDIQGALWNYKLIDDNRITQEYYKQNIERTIRKCIIAVDPAVTNEKDSDSTGITVIALSENMHAYVLADLTMKSSPETWAIQVAKAYEQFKCNHVVVEKNQGGDLLKLCLRGANKNLPIKLVQAKIGKYLRAEPCVALYERKVVHHVGTFPNLEKQMVTFCNNKKDEKSPDNLDSLVHGLTDLLLTATYQTRDFTNLGYY